MSEPAFDYRTYQRFQPPKLARAPALERAAYAWGQLPVEITFNAPDDELDDQLSELGTSLIVAGKSAAKVSGILWLRLKDWFESRILHSLPAAWALCGVSWGALIVFFAVQYFLR